jgi:hypothetical protein
MLVKHDLLLWHKKFIDKHLNLSKKKTFGPRYYSSPHDDLGCRAHRVGLLQGDHYGPRSAVSSSKWDCMGTVPTHRQLRKPESLTAWSTAPLQKPMDVQLVKYFSIAFRRAHHWAGSHPHGRFLQETG